MTGAWELLIDPIGESGPENMRRDAALLDEAVRSGDAFLRLYRWDPPTLSVGRNQPITFAGVPIVRRPTGGQAVWHEHEVTYAVAAPIALYGSLRNAYCQIHARIAKALRSLGIEATLAPASRPAARPAACFASPVGGEILVHGKKLVGSAQVRRQAAFLQHGSILLAGAQQHVGGAGAATTVAEALGRPVTFDEVVQAIIATWPEIASLASR